MLVTGLGDRGPNFTRLEGLSQGLDSLPVLVSLFSVWSMSTKKDSLPRLTLTYIDLDCISESREFVVSSAPRPYSLSANFMIVSLSGRFFLMFLISSIEFKTIKLLAQCAI